MPTTPAAPRTAAAIAVVVAGSLALATLPASGGGRSGPATASPAATLPVLALAGSEPRLKLVALDPATLRQLPSPRPLGIGSLIRVAPALSPRGDRVALAGRRAILIVDRRRLRVLRRLRDPDQLGALASEPPEAMAWCRDGGFVFTGIGKFGLALYFVSSLEADLDTTGDWLRTRNGIAVLAGTERGDVGVWPYSCAERDPIVLHALSVSAWAVDAHRNRAFVLSVSGQAVAVVNLETGRVAFRSVALPASLAADQAVRLVWAGGNRLAAWSDRGLVLIDTRTWTARAIDGPVSDVRAAPGSLITWNRYEPTGLAVLGPDGTPRFTALEGRRVTSIGVTYRHAYVEAGGRFSVDLRAGAVRGPLASRQQLILPDLLDLP